MFLINFHVFGQENVTEIYPIANNKWWNGFDQTRHKIDNFKNIPKDENYFAFFNLSHLALSICKNVPFAPFFVLNLFIFEQCLS